MKAGLIIGWIRGERSTMRVSFGLVVVLFVACYCNGCGREDGALSEGLEWEVRRMEGSTTGENPEFRRQRDEGIEGQNVELGLDYVV